MVVARADSQIAGDDFAFALLRQNASEKSTAFLRRKTLSCAVVLFSKVAVRE
jgi:hypothetical protein